jgi:hypothetical protein
MLEGAPTHLRVEPPLRRDAYGATNPAPQPTKQPSASYAAVTDARTEWKWLGRPRPGPRRSRSSAASSPRRRASASAGAPLPDRPTRRVSRPTQRSICQWHGRPLWELHAVARNAAGGPGPSRETRRPVSGARLTLPRTPPSYAIAKLPSIKAVVFTSARGGPRRPCRRRARSRRGGAHRARRSRRCPSARLPAQRQA